MGMRSESTFEQARKRYALTVDRLADLGLGRRTVSRVGLRDQYWTSTRDLLDEAMRLGFVVRRPLPSNRRYLDAHRERLHSLTELGMEVAEEAHSDMSKFCDRVSDSIYKQHPYFRSLLDSLRDGPISCPEVSEGEVEQARQKGLKTNYWVDLAKERLAKPVTLEDEEKIHTTLVSFVRHRFKRLNNEPTSKSLSEALNDAYIQVAVRLRGLGMGATDLSILSEWGTQLLLLDQSRYVPEFPRRNLIWLAADFLEKDGGMLRRRTLQENEIRINDAVVAAYRDRSDKSQSSLQTPYLPIYQIRAKAAFDCQVTRNLVDLVIERMTNGSSSDNTHQIQLHLGTTRQPASEPVYRRGGNQRYEITIHSQPVRALDA